jgi:hypothetical protein
MEGGMNTTFRRLSDEDIDKFQPWTVIARWAGWKIFAVIILLAVCVQWIVR